MQTKEEVLEFLIKDSKEIHELLKKDPNNFHQIKAYSGELGDLIVKTLHSLTPMEFVEFGFRDYVLVRNLSLQYLLGNDTALLAKLKAPEVQSLMIELREKAILEREAKKERV